MKPTLKVFVAEHCPGCDKALEIAKTITQNYPDAFTIEVIDIADPQAVLPERVFATPTFMLDDKIVSLGNPSLADVETWVSQSEMTSN